VLSSVAVVQADITRASFSAEIAERLGGNTHRYCGAIQSAEWMKRGTNESSQPSPGQSSQFIGATLTFSLSSPNIH
jgi:hypothetical protein